MDRRSFLGGLLGLAALPAWATPKILRAAAKGSVTAPPIPGTAHGLSTSVLQQQVLEDLRELGHFRLLYSATHPDPQQSHFVVLDQGATRTEMVIPVPIAKRHAIVISEGEDPAYAFLPELEGRRAALVGLREKKLLATAEPVNKDHEFSGHACFSRDGKSVFVPEFPIEENAGRGVVVERSLPGLEPRRTIETGHYRPHNLILTADGRTLLVGHYGRSRREQEPPSDGGLALVDLATGKARPAAATENPYLALCHLDRDAEDHVFVSTRSWAGHTQLMSPVLFGAPRGAGWESRLPETLRDRFRFNFSLRLAARDGVLAVAHLEGKLATFWDTKERKLLGELDLNGETPLGVEVTPDGRHFLINTTAGGLLYVDVKTRRLVKRTGIVGIGFCPHIAVLPGLARAEK